MAKSLATNSGLWEAGLRAAIEKLQKGAVDVLFNSAGLAIGSSSKAKVKIVNTIYAWIDGVIVKKTTAEVALSGTVANATFNVYVITLKADGTATARMGTAGATLGAVVMPTIPTDELVLGFAIVNPTGTGNFVGGTTELDDATVVPNAAYVQAPFGWNPSSLAL